MNTSQTGNNTLPKKKTGRFNLVDFLLIVIILLVIATVFYVFAPFAWIKDLSSSQTKNIQYTVEILGVHEDFIEKIKENDTVINSTTKNSLGVVAVVDDYKPKYKELQYAQNEEQMGGILSEHPHKYNLIVTISATANYVEGEGYSVNSTRIAVGEKMTLRFPNYTCEAYCIGLEQS